MVNFVFTLKIYKMSLETDNKKVCCNLNLELRYALFLDVIYTVSKKWMIIKSNILRIYS